MRKHLLYLSYLLRHKWFVFVAGLRTGAPLWRLLIHDWSKFLPCEWIPYAQFFYGQRLPKLSETFGDLRNHINYYAEDAELAFNRAWLHHQHANPHHWQHWVLREDSGDTKLLRIPTHFIREMVADWMGAGRTITGRWDVKSWYGNNRERILLSDETRKLVEVLLDA